MSVDLSTGVTHLASADRPRYGQPYPEGLAVGHLSVTGDASGGQVSATFLTDGGFLYRAEVITQTRGDTLTSTPNIVTSHEWATARAPVDAIAFNLNWILLQTQTSAFGGATLAVRDWVQLRRFPMGRTDQVTLQVLINMIDNVNTNLVVYEFDCIFSYWRTEALARPGFLQAFWEAPVVPGPLEP